MVIQFDNQPTLKEAEKMFYGLTNVETKVLDFLIEEDKALSSGIIADFMGLDQSTVQRAVKKIYEWDLCKRYQENQAKGGYHFIYKIKPVEERAYIFEKNLNKWHESMLTQLEIEKQ